MNDKNEYTQCANYIQTVEPTTGDSWTLTYRSHSPCIGCRHTDCPYWRPPCHKRHPYRPYPWWEWIPGNPIWTTETITWTWNQDTPIIY